MGEPGSIPHGGSRMVWTGRIWPCERLRNWHRLLNPLAQDGAWGPRGKLDTRSPSISQLTPALPCPACGTQALFQKKRKIHCLSSEMRPLLLCLPAPNHLKLSLEETNTQAFLSVSVWTSGSGTKGSQTSSNRGTKHISEVG